MPHDGVPDGFRNNQAEARTGGGYFDVGVVVMHNNGARSRARSTFNRPAKLGGRSKFVMRGKHDYAVSFARPFLRRAATIARPARVLMRVRKPCLRARRRLFGWNVRLPFATVILLGVVCDSRPPELKWCTSITWSGGSCVQHIAAIDHDRLRDLIRIKQIDTRVHPKLQRCFSSQLTAMFTVFSCVDSQASDSLNVCWCTFKETRLDGYGFGAVKQSLSKG